jgi:hypothetical protein
MADAAKAFGLASHKNIHGGRDFMSSKSHVFVIALSLFVLGGCVSIKQVLPPEGRQVEGGRNLLVTVPQNEIIAVFRNRISQRRLEAACCLHSSTLG